MAVKDRERVYQPLYATCTHYIIPSEINNLRDKDSLRDSNYLLYKHSLTPSRSVRCRS